METEVQEGQVKAEELALPTTREEVEARMDSDPDFRSKILTDNDFANQVEANVASGAPQGIPSPVPQGSGDDQVVVAPQGPAAGGAAEDEKVAIMVGDERVFVSKAAIDYYKAGGRTAGESLVEALKGIKEKDNTIDFYKNRARTSENDSVSLKTQLEEYKRNQAAGKRTAAPKPADFQFGPDEQIEDVDASILEELLKGDEFDDPLMDSTKRKALISTVQKLAKNNAALSSQMKKIGTTTSQFLSAEEQRKRESLQKDIVDSRKQKEFREIDELVSSAPELKLSKPFKELDLDIHEFMRDVGRVAGAGENFMDAVRLYYSETPEGQQLRERCEAIAVRPPEEIDKHAAIMRVRAERKAEIDRLRNWAAGVKGVKPEELPEHEIPDLPDSISYRSLYLAKRPPQADIQKEIVQAKIEARREFGTGQGSAAGAAEVPANLPPSDIRVQNVDLEKMSALLEKPTEKYDASEAELVFRYYMKEQIPPAASLVARLRQHGIDPSTLV